MKYSGVCDRKIGAINMTSKSFSENPTHAIQFIGTSEEAGTPTKENQNKVPDGYKLNPLYIEKKTRRVQALLQPSLYEKIRNRAIAESMSVNEMIHTLLEKSV